jgi:excisionase family DNA binding protein
MTMPDGLRRLVVSRSSHASVGRVLSIDQAADRLSVTPATIYAWKESKRLLAWKTTGRGVAIPAEQILSVGEVAPGLAQVFTVIPDPKAAWDFLSEESAFVDPERQILPFEALRDGRVDAVVAGAHSFLEAFS